MADAKKRILNNIVPIQLSYSCISGPYFFGPPDTPPPKITNHTEQPPKMAKTLPYGSLPHDGFWPVLGQNSCYEKTD